MPPVISPVIHFTLYSRSYCHLCDDMLAALRTLDGAQNFVIDVVDVDDDAELQALYDELVPVLFGRVGNRGVERLCHYFLDEEATKAFIANAN